MSNFTEVQQSDALNAFCDLDAFGEEVVYTPKGGTARTIRANVFRQQPKEVAGAAGLAAPYVEVFVVNSIDTTKGTPSIDRGGDTITVADVQGETARERTIAAILSQDPAGWMLRLR